MLLATLLGFAAAIWAFRSAGIHNILAVGSRLGLVGFLLYFSYSLGVFVLLGWAWLAAAGEPIDRLGLFTRARLLREAAADLLPFSQIGGITLGVWLLGSQVARARIYSSFVIDMLTEIASQLAFTMFGIGLLLSIPIAGGNEQVRSLITIGACLISALVLLMLLARNWGLALAEKMAHRFMPASVQAVSAVGGELRRASAPGRIAFVFLLNLAAWIASGIGAWIALRLMQIDFPLWEILSLESAIFALRSVAFAIPGGIGVQEAGYALLAPAIGLPAEAALALALIARQHGQRRVVMKQRVEHRAGRVAGAGMHHQAGRLVQHQQVFVLVDDVQVDRFGCAGNFGFQFRLQPHLLAAFEQLARHGRRTVQRHRAGLDPGGQARAGVVREHLGQSLVEPAASGGQRHDRLVANDHP